ncbi:hypothetical protein KNY83_004274 [Salmonella enterica subsp. enterica serovar Mbandaka]|nr:hypothetical protein [Salmonella enterica subsp. enterica serovar Mbandaka]EIO4300195.1 hypothetical protein [Salmonella enterica subsp. enterica serovar Cerro]EGT2272277.1 hypothetical protein [Salmonella enterica subsp. enterica serovar Mbandaka]EGT8114631.1 hypothetical protein [Salmonella enterica subsp. enterica serovar Mbandaka]EGW1008435.1 hypothetical protein [Salmonella enterica subsp. enterica serovar Mbandaka]
MSHIVIILLLLIIVFLSIRLRDSSRSLSSLELKNKTLLANEMILYSFLSTHSRGCMGRVLKNIKNSIIQLDRVITVPLKTIDRKDVANECFMQNVFYSYGDQIISLTRILEELSKHPDHAELNSMRLKIIKLFKGYNFRERAILILNLLQYDSQSFQHTKMISLICILEKKLTTLEGN